MIRHKHPANIARHDKRNFGQRAADAVATAIGSWRFLIIQSCILAGWMAANGWFIAHWLSGHPFDPYPFILLNLCLSCQAAYAAPILQLSQNRQAEHDRQRAEADYQTNETALAEIRANTALTEQVHALAEEVAGLVRELHERTASHEP